MTNYCIYEFQNFMDIMQTSQGRDKIFALIQQIVDLKVKCMRYSSDSSPIQMNLITSRVEMLVRSGQPTTRERMAFQNEDRYQECRFKSSDPYIENLLKYFIQNKPTDK